MIIIKHKAIYFQNKLFIIIIIVFKIQADFKHGLRFF